MILLTTVDVALLAAVLAAWGKHQYKKWDVKAASSASEGNRTETEKRACLSSFYLAAMRWSMRTSVTAVVISLIELPVFAWLMTRSVESSHRGEACDVRNHRSSDTTMSALPLKSHSGHAAIVGLQFI